MKDNSLHKMNFDEISKEEKAQLKHKITNSVYTYMQKKRRVKYAMSFAAASIVLLFSVGIFNYMTQDVSSIKTFVNSVQLQEEHNEVTLILNNEEGVEISESDSAITYSNNGQNVTIGNSKFLSQALSTQSEVVYNTLIVPYGKRSEIVLSDGSKVWLNSGSKLIFPAIFSEDKREVYLEGEAIFEVTHNEKKSFIVKSKNQDIEVLGTIFNVSNYSDDDSIFTVLKSGSVQIHYKNDNLISSKKHLKIAPNTLATYNKKAKRIDTITVDVEIYFSWRDGVFVFKNDALKTIMKKLSRYYNVDIIINDENLSNQMFSGYLDVNEDLDHVLKIINQAETSPFTYKMTDNNQLIIN
ncbi:FecR family protein [Psychroserpens burtonensis]|uniref:FecR family protein n=1 Tax=Psychroserpens burtonensis TaxID=49278 RepID=A0A5C7BGB1_9FLAO|nr:FecR domain-containing protein [Psychroserpens burtonensis]TXE17688.1 FecR family protein [Psychroserpens burtonensis]